MVEGGYDRFRLQYPHQCLNPQYTPENSNDYEMNLLGEFLSF